MPRFYLTTPTPEYHTETRRRVREILATLLLMEVTHGPQLDLTLKRQTRPSLHDITRSAERLLAANQ